MGTSVEILRNHGFPAGIISALKADGVTELLEHQVEAVLRFELLGQEDLLVSLPTSAGKTLIGELAGVGAALLGGRAVFSVPLKAIAREKFETFHGRYGDYGLRIRLATGEFSEHLEDLRRGRFDIAVIIHEKFKHVLLQDPGFLGRINVAIIDELQGVSEPSRGPSLEFLLAALKTSSPRVRRVGLVGVLAPHDPLVADFDGRVLTARQRPIDLRQGIVLTDPELVSTGMAEYGLELPDCHGNTGPHFLSIYRSHNSGLVETEYLPMGEVAGGEASHLLSLARGLADRGESVLVFLPSRREAEQAATILADSSPGQSDGTLDIEDETLGYCLQHGVAFHHADLSPRQRSLVEEAFRNGSVSVLCCTSTLAMGVNLPAANVLIHPFVWNSNGTSAELAPLPETIVRNMAGRAGRLGLGTGEARALLVADSQREWDLYRRLYWTTLIPPTPSPPSGW